MNKYVLIDCNGFCHKARFTTGELMYNGLHTGVIYGFLDQMLTIQSMTKSNNFIFLWDSKESERKKYYAEYKAGRYKNLTPEQQEELKYSFAQFTILRKRILPELGFNNNFIQDGFEADDLIAQVVEQLPSEDIVIASSDEDMYQLLSPNVKMLKSKGFYTVDNFVAEFGINPCEWVRVKAIAGCTSDNVKGVVGVGEKTACKYIKGELKNTHKTYMNIVSDEGVKIELYNKQLVKLPFCGTQRIVLTNNKFNIEKLKEFCTYYNFKSFEERMDEWSSFC